MGDILQGGSLAFAAFPTYDQLSDGLIDHGNVDNLPLSLEDSSSVLTHDPDEQLKLLGVDVFKGDQTGCKLRSAMNSRLVLDMDVLSTVMSAAGGETDCN